MSARQGRFNDGDGPWTTQPENTWKFTAADTITTGQVVGTTEAGQVQPVDIYYSGTVGVALNDADLGEEVVVQYAGVARVVSAEIGVGNMVESATGGTVAGSSDGLRAFGVALTAAPEGGGWIDVLIGVLVHDSD